MREHRPEYGSASLFRDVVGIDAACGQHAFEIRVQQDIEETRLSFGDCAALPVSSKPLRRHANGVDTAPVFVRAEIR